MARAKSSEAITPASESPSLGSGPGATPPPPSAPEPIVGTGWLIALSLWVTLFFLLTLYEGYGLLKGIIGF